LRIVYVVPPEPQLLICQGIDEDFKASNEQVEKQDILKSLYIPKPDLQIHPKELQFSCTTICFKISVFRLLWLVFDFLLIFSLLCFYETVELNTKISCSLQFSNKLDNYVAFKVFLIVYSLIFMFLFSLNFFFFVFFEFVNFDLE